MRLGKSSRPPSVKPLWIVEPVHCSKLCSNFSVERVAHSATAPVAQVPNFYPLLNYARASGRVTRLVRDPGTRADFYKIGWSTGCRGSGWLAINGHDDGPVDAVLRPHSKSWPLPLRQ